MGTRARTHARESVNFILEISRLLSRESYFKDCLCLESSRQSVTSGNVSALLLPRERDTFSEIDSSSLRLEEVSRSSGFPRSIEALAQLTVRRERSKSDR